jgi:3D (Asp-Asp-Asp) domain-containing protein
MNSYLLAGIAILLSANFYVGSLNYLYSISTPIYTAPITKFELTGNSNSFEFEKKSNIVIEEKAIITAYNTVPEQTSGDPCISADGTNICGLDNVLACPRAYPFGTKVEILGKEYVCRDRLAQKYDNRFDISFDKDVEGARQWGKRHLTVRILSAEQ